MKGHAVVSVITHPWRIFKPRTIAVAAAAVVLEAARRIGMSWIEELALTLVIGVLQKVIKNPQKLGVTDTVIQHIRDDATTALDAMNPAAPPPPGYVKAS